MHHTLFIWNLWFSCLDIVCICESAVWSYPLLLGWSFSANNICLMKLGALMFSAYIFTNLISSGWISLFINMQCLCVSDWFCLRFALLDMNIAIRGCFQIPFSWSIFFHPFTFSLCMSLSVGYIFWEQQWLDPIFKPIN